MIEFSEGPVLIPRRPGQSLADLLAGLAGPQLRLSVAKMSAVLECVDALDIVKLVMEVEEALR